MKKSHLGLIVSLLFISSLAYALTNKKFLIQYCSIVPRIDGAYLYPQVAKPTALVEWNFKTDMTTTQPIIVTMPLLVTSNQGPRKIGDLKASLPSLTIPTDYTGRSLKFSSVQATWDIEVISIETVKDKFSCTGSLQFINAINTSTAAISGLILANCGNVSVPSLQTRFRDIQFYIEGSKK